LDQSVSGGQLAEKIKPPTRMAQIESAQRIVKQENFGSAPVRGQADTLFSNCAERAGHAVRERGKLRQSPAWRERIRPLPGKFR